ncbi:MAG TPA: CHRD domain-containing protein [Rugosimonospora sp.]|nr:CHRD domain-containing protein [Rugosimonospora sp.]
MRKVLIGFLAMGLCVLGLGAMWIVRADDADDDDTLKFTAKIDGFQEVGALNNETGAILTEGKGTLELTLNKNAQTLTYELTYSFPATETKGATNVRVSHIHFGKVHTPGGIMVFFCTNLGNGPGGTPPCPTPEGRVTGTITASGVQAILGQQVSADDFAAVVAALASNTAYANIHTDNFPAGEIRGQIHMEGRRRDHDDK